MEQSRLDSSIPPLSTEIPGLKGWQFLSGIQILLAMFTGARQ